MTQHQKNELFGLLEDSIDQNGLSHTLRILSEICLQKSIHLSENWQDENQAKDWDKKAGKIEKLASVFE